MSRAIDTTDAQFESLARTEAGKFHIDLSRYTLRVVQRGTDSCDAQVIFDGAGEGNVFPCLSMLFTEHPIDWDIRAELSFDAHEKTGGLIFVPNPRV